MALQRAAATAMGLLLIVQEAIANAVPAAFAGGDLIGMLKERGEAPVRTVACVGAAGSGKTTLMKSIFGEEAAPEEGLALLEARSDCSYSAEGKGYRIGTGQAMVSLAVSDVVIYNVLVHDLTRPEAMSDLQPALEELLSLYEDGVVDPEQPKTLVVAVRDCIEGTGDEVKEAVSNRLGAIWKGIVKPEGFDAASLEDVVEVKVSCLPHHSFATDSFLAEVSQIRSNIMEGVAETAAVEVARLLQQVSVYAGPEIESVKLGDLHSDYQADMAVARYMGIFKSLLARMGATFSELNPEFGESCDGVVDTVIEEYNDFVTKRVPGGAGGAVVSKKRAELKRAMLRELGTRHEMQVLLLREAAMAKFRESLSGMRVTANVGKDMADAIEEADKYFATTAKGLQGSHESWPCEQDRRELKATMREFANERLQLAKAQGAYVPSSNRRPVTVAFHWLLPKPFGADARRSGMTAEDPMAYVDKPTSSSPMFFSFTAPDKLKAPEGGTVEVPEEYNHIIDRASSLVYRPPRV
ncbi:unnamed protein product [Discosporangium mesarthrocarpum]